MLLVAGLGLLRAEYLISIFVFFLIFILNFSYFFRSEETGNLSTCDPIFLKHCAERQLKRMDEFWEACQQSCMSPCFETGFESLVSKTLLRTGSVSHVLGENPLYSNDYSILHVFYPTLMTTTIEEFQLGSFHSFMSRFGGQLGLYVGASLITIIQLLVLFLCRNAQELCMRNTDTVIRPHQSGEIDIS